MNIMNTTATSFSSDRSSWIAAGGSPDSESSSESVYSIQGKETDFVRDTSDTDFYDSDVNHVEYEPVTESEEEAAPIIVEESSSFSDDDIISTEVLSISVGNDAEVFADGENEDTDGGDSELTLKDYWQCAQCRAKNNNPRYSYCEKCFKVRKNFFPSRPKRKSKRTSQKKDTNVHQVVKSSKQFESDVDSAFNSQELSSQGSSIAHSRQNSEDICQIFPSISAALSDNPVAGPSRSPIVGSSMGNYPFNLHDAKLKSDMIIKQIINRKRRALSLMADREGKKARSDSNDLDSNSDEEASNNRSLSVIPLTKTISDPSLTIETDSKLELTKKGIANSLKEKFSNGKDDLCIVCFTEPKSGVFVHGRIAHICCCYKCSVKVWATVKRCPVCNRKVSNVLKAVIM